VCLGFKIAFDMDATFKRMALDDPDFEPLWAALGQTTNHPIN
jgi:hypothetical protein